eukprot:2412915-Pleurochrysis_carterae.AAC.1
MPAGSMLSSAMSCRRVLNASAAAMPSSSALSSPIGSFTNAAPAAANTRTARAYAVPCARDSI